MVGYQNCLVNKYFYIHLFSALNNARCHDDDAGCQLPVRVWSMLFLPCVFLDCVIPTSLN